MSTQDSWEPPAPYSHEEWSGDPSEGRSHPGRTRVTVDALFAEVERLREALRPLDLAVRVSLAFQRPTVEGHAHLLDVERVETSADLVGYLRVALDRARAALAGKETP